MPRRPMMIDIPDNPGAVSSLLSGVASGLNAGLQQQDAEDRRNALRREIYLQELQRDNVNWQRNRAAQGEDWNRNRAAHLEDVAGAQAFQVQQAQALEARRQAEEARKNADEASRAGTLQDLYESSGIIPGEVPMPDGVAGPGTRPPRLTRPEDVRAYGAALEGQRQRAAVLADRETDNARQQAQADETARHNRAMEARPAGGGKAPLTPEERQRRIQTLVSLGWYNEDEAANVVDAVGGGLMSSSQVKPQVGTSDLDNLKRERDVAEEVLKGTPRTIGASHKLNPAYQTALDDFKAKASAYNAAASKPRAKPQTGPVSQSFDPDSVDSLLNALGP